MNESRTTGHPHELVTETSAKSYGCGMAVLLVIGFTTAGLLGGILLGIAGEMPTWSRLDLGQDKALRFLGADGSAAYPRKFYINMASGQVYDCLLEKPDPKLGKRCFEVTTEQTSETRAKCPTDLVMPPAPGGIVDLLCEQRDTFSMAYLAILNDGNLWEWIDYKTLGPVGIRLGAPLGLFVGFVAGGIAAVFWIARSRRSGQRKV